MPRPKRNSYGQNYFCIRNFFNVRFVKLPLTAISCKSVHQLVSPLKQSSSGGDTNSPPFPKMPQASASRVGLHTLASPNSAAGGGHDCFHTEPKAVRVDSRFARVSCDIPAVQRGPGTPVHGPPSTGPPIAVPVGDSGHRPVTRRPRTRGPTVPTGLRILPAPSRGWSRLSLAEVCRLPGTVPA